MPTITICLPDVKIVTLRGHARDYVSTSGAVSVDGVVRLVKTVGFCTASSHV